MNILDSELISPIYHYQVTVEYLVKDLISGRITEILDKEIEVLKEKMIDEGKEYNTEHFVFSCYMEYNVMNYKPIRSFFPCSSHCSLFIVH